MAKKKNIAFSVKLKVIPKRPYKHFFLQGVVTAPNQKSAEDTAIGMTEGWINTDDGIETNQWKLEAKCEIVKTIKLRSDFLLGTK